jgi:hypothetical protein
LDRVSVFETEGWEFEPLRARQSVNHPHISNGYEIVSCA